MTSILQPAINYARKGFPVSELIAYYWNLSILARKQYPGFIEQYTLDGRAPKTGEIWKNPNLANTLEEIATGGRDAFYKGEIAQTIADYMKKAAKSYPSGDPEVLREGGTIYLTTAEKDGNMVSLIQSNYRGMGSGMTPPGLGFILQDRGELFTLEEGHFNSFEAGKRPFHTIIPAFITKNGQPWISFGLMGGGMQPQGHVQIVTNLIDFGMNLQEAGDAPRWHHYGSSQPAGETMTDGGWVTWKQVLTTK